MAAVIGALGTISIPAGTEQHKDLSMNEIKKLITNPTTAADNQRIADYFNAESEKFEAEATEHDELAASYDVYASTNPGPAYKATAARSAEHCHSLASHLRKAAEEDRELVIEHIALKAHSAK